MQDFPAKVSSKGQVTVPKPIRDELGIVEREVVIRLDGGRIVLGLDDASLETAGDVAAGSGSPSDTIVARVNARGQVTVPKPIRDALDLSGSEVVFRRDGPRAMFGPTAESLSTTPPALPAPHTLDPVDDTQLELSDPVPETTDVIDDVEVTTVVAAISSPAAAVATARLPWDAVRRSRLQARGKPRRRAPATAPTESTVVVDLRVPTVARSGR